MAEVLLAGVWFLLFLTLHFALFHTLAIRDQFRVIVLLLVGAALGTCASIWLDRDSLDWLVTAGRIVAGESILLSLFILYMPFYYSVANSLSIQTMIAVEKAQDGMLDIRGLARAFTSETVIQKRLHTMAANGYVILDRRGYRLTKKGRLVARMFRGLKVVWKLGAGG